MFEFVDAYDGRKVGFKYCKIKLTADEGLIKECFLKHSSQMLLKLFYFVIVTSIANCTGII